jgi:predicted  nucleic acid-binding Zn-ribbon protein
MPHQCINCGTIHDDTSDAILNGCTNCGKKLFLYIKSSKKETMQEEIEITQQNKEAILKEIEQNVGTTNPDKPIFLKIENIHVISPGKYEIDINQLLKKDKPLIYRVGDGTFVIDLEYLQSRY